MIEMDSERAYLSFCTKTLNLLGLWINKTDQNVDKCRFLKDTWLILFVIPAALSVLGDLTMHLIYETSYNLIAIIDNLIAFNCSIGMDYMIILFIIKRQLVKKLLCSIDNFKKYGGYESFVKTDIRANFTAKVFVFYTILGNILNLIMPILSTDEKCEAKKAEEIVSNGVPCTLLISAKFPFKFDYSPVYEIIIIHQFCSCTLNALAIIVLTMLLCGILMHATNLFKNLRRIVEEVAHKKRITKKDIRICIKYHIEVINYSEDINGAFSKMVLVHFAQTSLVIAGLGFEIMTATSLKNSIRFSVHLLGWVCLLFLVCYYGQLLIDESIAIAHDIYTTPWFKASVEVQKDIRMVLRRSQKPLTLSAANVGVMSLPTFSTVISSSYSYFALLWNSTSKK